MSAAKKRNAIPSILTLESLDSGSLTELKRAIRDSAKVAFSEASPQRLLELALNTSLRHFVPSSAFDTQHELRLSETPKRDWKKFFSDPGLFLPIGVNGRPSAPLISEPIHNRGDKATILAGLRQCLLAAKVNQTLVAEVLLVADEMVSNAIFNAPFVPLDNQRSGIDRKSNVLSENFTELAQFKLFLSDTTILVSCVDFFGRLNIGAFLQRILDCYDQGLAKKMNMGHGGAGIGSHMMYHHSMGMYLAVQKEHATCVACAFPRSLSSRKREGLAKTLHIFDIKEGDK